MGDIENTTWEQYWSQICKVVASKSKDQSTKVGCILINPEENLLISMGYNGFIRKANDKKKSWHARPKKYLVTIHAEINAICSAALAGHQTINSVAYITHFPCSRCTSALIQAGVKAIYVVNKPTQDFLLRWKEDFSTAKEIIKEAKIPLQFLEDKRTQE